MNTENTIIDKKRQAQLLLGLELKHRAKRLSAITGKNFDAKYFAKIHNRSTEIIYRAWRGGAPVIQEKMRQHLDYLEKRYVLNDGNQDECPGIPRNDIENSLSKAV